VPALAPASRGCPAMLAVPAPPRNSLRSLRELRSDSRGESEVRSALRARAGTAALLGCAQARRQRTAQVAGRALRRPLAHTLAGTVAAFAAHASLPRTNATDVSRARFGSGPAPAAAGGRGVRSATRSATARWGAAGPGAPRRCLRRRAAQPRGRRAKRASSFWLEA